MCTMIVRVETTERDGARRAGCCVTVHQTGIEGIRKRKIMAESIR